MKRASIAAAFVALAVSVSVSLCRIVELDTPWYVAAGDLIARTRSLPRTDPFSYTSSRPWLNHEWLSELLLAGVHRLGGFAALSWLVALIVAVIVLLIFRDHLLIGWNPLVWTLLVFVLREASSPRAQLFSSLLFAVTLVLALREDDDHVLWWCVPIQLVWSQLHGGDPVGVAVLGLTFLGAPTKQRAIVSIVCALATICGPYGIYVHAHFLGAHAALPLIREWAPLHEALLAGARGPWVAVALIALGWIALVMRRTRRDVLLMLVFTIVAVRYVRFSTEAAIVAAAIAAQRTSMSRALVLRTLGAAALLVLLLPLSARTVGTGLEPSRFPEETVAWCKAHAPSGPMLNSYNFGGYLLWAWPAQRVFVDGRAFTVYDESIVGALPAIYDDPTRFSALDARWHFRLAVLQRNGRGADFARWLGTQPGWQLAHEDSVAVVLTR